MIGEIGSLHTVFYELSGEDVALSDFKTDRQLDATGIYCPEPVMMLHSAIDELSAGDTLKVLATDPSTKRDIPKFCNFLGHELLSQEELEGEYQFIIRKG